MQSSSALLLLGLVSLASGQNFDCGDGSVIEYELGGIPAVAIGQLPHLLFNPARKEKDELRWLPPANEPLRVLLCDNGDAQISGDLTLGAGQPEMSILLELRDRVEDYEDCFCYDDMPYTEKQYKRTQGCGRKPKKYMNNAQFDEYFCPKCESDQCLEAYRGAGTTGAPDPVFENWNMYRSVAGGLSGPGLPIFRDAVKALYRRIPDTQTECSFSIQNLPLPQLYCTDYESPFLGLGYGVNGKNQRCGFAMWFNCEEDLQYLGEDDFKKKSADINMELTNLGGFEVPTPRPTKWRAPTPQEPEVVPTPNPTKRKAPTPQEPEVIPTPNPTKWRAPTPREPDVVPTLSPTKWRGGRS